MSGAGFAEYYNICLRTKNEKPEFNISSPSDIFNPSDNWLSRNFKNV